MQKNAVFPLTAEQCGQLWGGGFVSDLSGVKEGLQPGPAAGLVQGEEQPSRFTFTALDQLQL